MFEGLFSDNRVIMEVLNYVKTRRTCNRGEKWEWVTSEYDFIPGHACGVPRLPTIQFLYDIFMICEN